ncbi:NADH-dependent formate dehydrogenase delta subunit FdsD [Pseudonocardia autotrophica]|uniref:NADH-dependent formate dehydrogenase delta subunit FdsD n=2 Tax=Pseudonocardia TaxID=1847 RepID=A0A1Y2MKC9_PSEAH|nr:NADH-dependent formate dehydrogenase delta subunit FdsD [Pseudonocardia autotrophica]
MVHEIARQFADRPATESVETIAAHLRKFWAPAMITNLIEDADRGADLDPLVAGVVAELRPAG